MTGFEARRSAGWSAAALVALGLLAAAGGGAPAGAAAPGSPTDGFAPTQGLKRIVLENERVRAQAIEYPPGARGAEHEHAAPRVVVVLEGGTLEVRDPAGKASTLRLKTGDVVWRPAERHAIANPGATAVRLVEIDVLDCPPR
jgi:quercetin dioxygenase-like cupin family protein